MNETTLRLRMIVRAKRKKVHHDAKVHFERTNQKTGEEEKDVEKNETVEK